MRHRGTDTLPVLTRMCPFRLLFPMFWFICKHFTQCSSSTQAWRGLRCAVLWRPAACAHAAAHTRADLLCVKGEHPQVCVLQGALVAAQVGLQFCLGVCVSQQDAQVFQGKVLLCLVMPAVEGELLERDCDVAFGAVAKRLRQENHRPVIPA
jgi:hypothetical protein